VHSYNICAFAWNCLQLGKALHNYTGNARIASGGEHIPLRIGVLSSFSEDTRRLLMAE
jgi:hypothetical protein